MLAARLKVKCQLVHWDMDATGRWPLALTQLSPTGPPLLMDGGVRLATVRGIMDYLIQYAAPGSFWEWSFEALSGWRVILDEWFSLAEGMFRDLQTLEMLLDSGGVDRDELLRAHFHPPGESAPPLHPLAQKSLDSFGGVLHMATQEVLERGYLLPKGPKLPDLVMAYNIRRAAAIGLESLFVPKMLAYAESIMGSVQHQAAQVRG